MKHNSSCVRKLSSCLFYRIDVHDAHEERHEYKLSDLFFVYSRNTSEGTTLVGLSIRFKKAQISAQKSSDRA